MTARVRKLIEGCEFITRSDVLAEKVDDYLDGRPDGMSQQTAHFYAQAFKRFCRWMFEQGYIERPPNIRSVSVARHYGRHFELDEFEALLEAARTGPERCIKNVAFDKMHRARHRENAGWIGFGHWGISGISKPAIQSVPKTRRL